MTVWIHITAGSGPVECCEAVFLFKNYLYKYFENKNHPFVLINSIPGPETGTLSSVLLSASHVELMELKKFEGTIKWVCKSRFRPSHARKNWYIAMEILEEPLEVHNNLEAVRYESIQAGGPGGQHQNKTESAIRLIHIPTNIQIVAREERSQHQNKKLALARLAAILQKNSDKLKANFEQQCWETHKQIIRGNEIQTFKGCDFDLLK
ncbi:MAG: peptide chain release factor-like protein [Francisellaceae bacterium]|nr:peptide chain release factor-like protein [Francisellaceae bacterium]